ncbi:MAG: hypothetical protein IJW13_06665 [Clostridia bacterium]|nr:hypothetical protein [Clostridia bacterium]
MDNQLFFQVCTKLLQEKSFSAEKYLKDLNCSIVSLFEITAKLVTDKIICEEQSGSFKLIISEDELEKYKLNSCVTKYLFDQEELKLTANKIGQSLCEILICVHQNPGLTLEQIDQKINFKVNEYPLEILTKLNCVENIQSRWFSTLLPKDYDALILMLTQNGVLGEKSVKGRMLSCTVRLNISVLYTIKCGDLETPIDILKRIYDNYAQIVNTNELRVLRSTGVLMLNESPESIDLESSWMAVEHSRGALPTHAKINVPINQSFMPEIEKAISEKRPIKFNFKLYVKD